MNPLAGFRREGDPPAATPYREEGCAMLGRLLDRLDLAVSDVVRRLRTPHDCHDLRPAWARRLDRWRPAGRCPDREPTVSSLRPLAPAVCLVCWRRWEVDRLPRHRACERALIVAMDTYYERTRWGAGRG